ncbi:MAG: serine/threonine-protein kinase [Planctomycetota bacterium]
MNIKLRLRDDDSDGENGISLCSLLKSKPMRGIEYGNRFTLGQQIGVGGEGKVFEAYDSALERNVALKFVDRQEAVTIAQLNHPSIIPIYDSLEIPNNRFSHFHVMPICPKPKLSERIKRKAKESKIRQNVGRLIAVCYAVKYAHKKGIIHRDIKPDNILVGEQGQTYLSDWGLAGKLGDKIGDAVGTRGFTSPVIEIADGVLTESIDIYSLGATLYTILTGETPVYFDGGKRVNGFSRIRSFQRPTTPFLSRKNDDDCHSGGQCKKQVVPSFFPPHTINRRAPKELSAICLRALGDTSTPYKCVSKMISDLECWTQDEPLSEDTMREPWLDHQRRWLGNNKFFLVTRLLLIGALVSTIVLASLSVSIFLKNRQITGHQEHKERLEAIASL